MVFETPSEPTDIIWENRHFTNRDYFFRQLWATIIIAILLAVSVLVIYKISAFSAKMAAVFPPVDCEGIITIYGSGLQTSAVSDYEYITANEGEASDGTL